MTGYGHLVTIGLLRRVFAGGDKEVRGAQHTIEGYEAGPVPAHAPSGRQEATHV